MVNSKMLMQNQQCVFKGQRFEGAMSDAARQYLQAMGKISEPLTPQQEKILAQQVQQGNRVARQKMIQANLRLVVAVAKRFKHTPNVDMMDLMQEGNVGLMTAVDKFNPQKGVRFSTYATWWIYQKMHACVTASRYFCYIPSNTVTQLNKIKRYREQMLETKGAYPSAQQISEALGMSLPRINELLPMLKRVVSLDAPVSQGSTQASEALTWGDIAVAQGGQPDGMVEKNETQQILDDLFDTVLNAREQYIVTKRYRDDNEVSSKRPTLEMLGSELGISREAVRKTEKRALNKLRSHRLFNQMVE